MVASCDVTRSRTRSSLVACGETVVGGSWNLGDAGGRGGVDGTVMGTAVTGLATVSRVQRFLTFIFLDRRSCLGTFGFP